MYFCPELWLVRNCDLSGIVNFALQTISVTYLHHTSDKFKYIRKFSFHQHRWSQIQVVAGKKWRPVQDSEFCISYSDFWISYSIFQLSDFWHFKSKSLNLKIEIWNQIYVWDPKSLIRSMKSEIWNHKPEIWNQNLTSKSEIKISNPTWYFVTAQPTSTRYFVTAQDKDFTIPRQGFW